MLFSKFGSNFIIFFPLNRAMRLRSLCIRVVVCFCWFPELALTHFTGRAEQTASTQWAPLLTTAFKISKVCRSYLNMSPRAGKRRKLSNRRPKMRGGRKSRYWYSLNPLPIMPDTPIQAHIHQDPLQFLSSFIP